MTTLGATRLHLFLAFVCALLFGCGTAGTAARRGPELARYLENSDSSYRIDIMPRGHGSGVVISPEGHILTAAHVVAGRPTMTISIVEGSATPTVYTATVLATDEAHDLAVVKVDRRFRTPVVIEDPENVHAGDSVYNIGYPYSFGEMLGRGYIMRLRYSHTDRAHGVEINDALLLDIPDGPGTSGSGIFSAATGRLVGVMTATYAIGAPGVPPTIVRVATRVDHVRAFLDANRIPYLRPTDPAPVAASAPRDAPVDIRFQMADLETGGNRG